MKTFVVEKKKDLIFGAVLLLLLLVGIFRCFYTLNPNDEMYYLSTIWRVFKGDAILVEEWFPAQQLCTFFLLPIYGFWYTVLHGNEGMLLAIRLTYLLFQAIIAVYGYLQIRNREWFATIPVFLFVLTVPFNLNAFSYNTLAIAFMFILLISLANNREISKVKWVFLGVIVANLVLANPFTSLLYFLWGIVVIIALIISKIKKIELPRELQMKNFIFMTIGVFIVFVLFVWFVFSRASYADIKVNLPYILGNSEYSEGVLVKSKKYFLQFWKYYKPIVITFAIVLLGVVVNPKRSKFKVLYLLPMAVACIAMIIYYGFFGKLFQINYIFAPVAFCGVIAYLITENKNKRLFFGAYLPSILYTFCVQLCTDTHMVGVSIATGLATGLTFYLLGICVFEEQKKQEENKNTNKEKITIIARRFAIGIFISLLAVQFVTSIYQRATFATYGQTVAKSTMKFDKGPAKGIYVSQEFADYFNAIYKELDIQDLTESESILVIGVEPWMYLYADSGCGSYTTWQITENDELLRPYFMKHPDKMPSLIYCVNYQKDTILNTSLGQYFLQKRYEPVQVETGVLFHAK